MGRFRNALAAPGLGAIAEVKRRSPSAGDLRPDADAAALAKAFEESGAAAVYMLVEAHDPEEHERAVALGAEIIGVNARDLGTFTIDRTAQLELVARAPRDRVVVAESAVHTRAQAAAAELAGANAVLVGTSLMRAAEPGAKLHALLSRPLVKVCGLTRQEDVDAAVEAGADLCGFVLARETPRRGPPRARLPGAGP